jgi:ubiquinone/menaquinone biosynthesis C-methylase UbiE
MEINEENKVCSVEHAGLLDISLRKLVNNPHKILDPYIKEGMSVMDLGCGPGFFTLEMAKMVGKNGKVTAVDLQKEMLEIVRKKIIKTNLQTRVEFHNCPDNNIGLSKTFDFILVFYMLHEVPDKTAFLKEVFSLLKCDGKVLVVEPKFHVTKNEFDNSIDTLKKIGFDIIEDPKVFFSRAVLIKKR